MKYNNKCIIPSLHPRKATRTWFVCCKFGLHNVNLVCMIKTNNTSTLYQFYCAHFNKLLFIPSETSNYLVRLYVYNIITAYRGVL